MNVLLRGVERDKEERMISNTNKERGKKGSKEEREREKKKKKIA